MQNKRVKQEYVLLPVPAGLLFKAGIFEGETMEMSVENGKIIIQNADPLAHFVCDGNCDGCPMAEVECDGECDACPCSAGCDESEAD